jgi:hypothetical protein
MISFQCNGCPKGPHMVTGLDPEFDPGEICIDSTQKGNRAVWRELVPAGESDQDLPSTCKECGGHCSKTERDICLAEMDGGN